MKPSKIYADIETLEKEALNQYNKAMSLDCVVQGALMPDSHVGFTLPIGAVIATDGVIFPNFIGFDIGCGMCATKLNGVSKFDIIENKDNIYELIYQYIPVGFNINKGPEPYTLDGLTNTGKEIAEYKKYNLALGSLGGGNHFIEIGYDETDNVWVIIHSGSRGVGHGIATHYMKLAHPDGKCKDGHYGFDTKSKEGKDYIQDLNWCLEFALKNRKVMLLRTIAAIGNSTGKELDTLDFINRNHNHAENKDGLFIHRKGATHAELGMEGVIPGNMRDGSFIVKGKGNPDSLCSSSHGAGRVLGRNQARKTLNLDDFKSTMGNIKANVKESTLDESPFAYKDIFQVMELQKDLVEITNYVKPIINIKG